MGDTATRDTLQFKVAGGFWRQHTATFELEIRDADGNVWVETTEADFVSPQIPLKGLVVLDGGAGSIRGFGNGDGVPNPGETIGLQAVTESPEELSPFNVVFGTEDALVRGMGSSFLIASDAPPGHRISFETQVEGHFAAYRDTLYVEVIGKDETPPQVLHAFSDPSAMEPGASTTIKVPKRSVVEGGRISRIEARIYALTDLEWVDTVVLQEKSEEFHGVWSYPGTGRFHVRIFAEDEAGNGAESRPLDVLVFYIPSGPPSSGEWTTWTNTGEVTALTFQGNTLWAGTTGGVVRWDLSNGTYVEYTILDGMAGNHVSSLLVDASGNPWAHTKEGLCYYDWAGWKRATDGDGVIGERDIRTATPTGGLLLDHSGNVWVGGLNGVSRYDGTTWTTWTKEDIGLPSLWKPTVLLEDHAGNVWAGGWFGVGSFDGEMWTAWTSYAFSFIRTLGVDDLGRVWAGAGNWVSRFDGSEWNHWRTGGDVNRLLSDGSGKLWVGTTKGVSRFDGIGWTDWSIEDDLGGSEGQTSRFDFYRGKCHGVGSLLADAAGHVWAG
ncbi:MAG: hypothetical protein KAI38_06735, partial [Candidatus Latescibacteria bacterium]|nr:hypothetical protein [Candidatus Latescibacterota bacterium]